MRTFQLYCFLLKQTDRSSSGLYSRLQDSGNSRAIEDFASELTVPLDEPMVLCVCVRLLLTRKRVLCFRVRHFSRTDVMISTVKLKDDMSRSSCGR